MTVFMGTSPPAPSVSISGTRMAEATPCDCPKQRQDPVLQMEVGLPGQATQDMAVTQGHL